MLLTSSSSCSPPRSVLKILVMREIGSQNPKKMDPNPHVSQTPIPEIWQFPLVGVPPSLKINGRDSSLAESTVTDHSGGSRGRRRRWDSAPPSEDESSNFVSTSSGNDATDTEAKHPKGMKSRDDNENGESKTGVEVSSGLCDKTADQSIQPSEAPKQDYIHVQARRGQATDSHSLAERARREKISERTKILQDLVPGCNKVIGKASVLDEIINYIQALQHQVEFLSIKLKAVNSLMNPGIEAFPSKDFGAQAYETPTLAFGSQTPREYAQGPATDRLHMQVGGALERVT